MQAATVHSTSYGAPQAPLSSRPTRTFRQLSRKLERDIMQTVTGSVTSMAAPQAGLAEQEPTANDAVTACYVRGYN